MRVMLVKGWGEFDEGSLNGNSKVLVVESAPYDLLFPFVKAVVHHGGIGTIAACLRAGRPFLSCPVLYPLGDQYFWGKIAAGKGVGITPIPLKKATVAAVVEAIRRLASDRTLHENARSIAVKLQRENGVKEAMRIIETL